MKDLVHLPHVFLLTFNLITGIPLMALYMNDLHRLFSGTSVF